MIRSVVLGLAIRLLGSRIAKRIYYSTRTYDYDELMVTIATNWGDMDVSLTEWISVEPNRPFTRIIAVKYQHEGEIPIYAVPLKYRNDSLSVFLVRYGIINEGWSGHRKRIIETYHRIT